MSAIRWDVALSTLTVENLTSNITYEFRLGAMNQQRIPYYQSLGQQITSAGAAPVNPTMTAVYITSMTVQWGDVDDNTGYVVEASTSATFVPVEQSSVTLDIGLGTLDVLSLQPNTTYYLRTGALYNGATSYADTTPASTATLASYITTSQFYRIMTTSVTVNWLPFSSGSGVNTAIVYRLLASSTSSNGTGVVYSTEIWDVALSTLTVENLTSNITYEFRLGAMNQQRIPNYLSLGQQFTSAGAAPVNPTITAVYITSMTVQWGDVADNSGYVVQASSWNGWTGTSAASSVTADADALVLSPQGLSANTTYWLRAGALYNGTTSYAYTTPQVTSTLTGTGRQRRSD